MEASLSYITTITRFSARAQFSAQGMTGCTDYPTDSLSNHVVRDLFSETWKNHIGASGMMYQSGLG